MNCAWRRLLRLCQRRTSNAGNFDEDDLVVTRIYFPQGQIYGKLLRREAIDGIEVLYLGTCQLLQRQSERHGVAAVVLGIERGGGSHFQER